MTPFDGPLVSAAWLADRGSEGLVLADVRWRTDVSAREGFLRGHLPGAVSIDADVDLAGPVDARSGRHPLPSPDAFAAAMERAGIGDETPVVAYDIARGSYAARLWWMLDVLGHPVALLDGGLDAWTGLETGEGDVPEPARFTPRPWPEDLLFRGAEGVIDALRSGMTVIDARAGERYRGEEEPFDPVAGHIPGALSLPWGDLMDPATGRFRNADALRAWFAAAGIDEAEGVIAQCGSGVTACVDIVALRIAGMGRARLYVGSWSEWVSDPARPVATGPEPGSLV
jgi:thiosulfate/3-mercaptopyruvate sulfurtransferase